MTGKSAILLGASPAERTLAYAAFGKADITYVLQAFRLFGYSHVETVGQVHCVRMGHTTGLDPLSPCFIA